MTIKRVSPRGLSFQLHTICDERNKTIVQLAETVKKMTFEFPIEQICQAWYNWQVRGEFVQKAFSFLSTSEREFLISGITPEEWDETFKFSEED